MSKEAIRLHQFRNVRVWGAALTIAISCVTTLTSSAGAQSTAPAVEYYHSVFDHYFVTSSAVEIQALDGGAFGGAWKRTGHTFSVWTQPRADTSATCRFFTVAFPPRSSHFYTPIDAECTALSSGRVWQFEGTAFQLRLPDMQGTCPAGTATLHRLYNEAGSGAPNHRYTTSQARFDLMRSQGWTPEGSGRGFAFACVPTSVTQVGSPRVTGASFEFVALAPVGWRVANDANSNTSDLLSPATATAIGAGHAKLPPDVVISIEENTAGLSPSEFAGTTREGKFAKYRSRRAILVGGESALLVDDEGSSVTFEPVRAALISRGAQFIVVSAYKMTAEEFDGFLSSVSLH